MDDAPGVEAAALDAARRSDGAETNRRLLQELGRRLTDSGVVPWRGKPLAHSVRRGETTIKEARRRLEERGHLTLLAEAEAHLTDDGWRKTPALYHMPPELRPPAVKRSLRDWLVEQS